MSMILFWLVFSIAVILIDVFTSSFLFVWFSIGGAAACIASIIGMSIKVQIIIFIVVNIISVLIGYPWAKRKFRRDIERTALMEEEYIGRELVAEEDIDRKAQIKIGGIYWSVINKGCKINKNEKFIIKGISGTKFLVERKEEA